MSLTRATALLLALVSACGNPDGATNDGPQGATAQECGVYWTCRVTAQEDAREVCADQVSIETGSCGDPEDAAGNNRLALIRMEADIESDAGELTLEHEDGLVIRWSGRCTDRFVIDTDGGTISAAVGIPGRWSATLVCGVDETHGFVDVTEDDIENWNELDVCVPTVGGC